MILTFLKNTGQLFYRLFFKWGLLDVSSYFWQESHKCGVVFFRAPYPGGTRLIFLMTQKVEVVPARFLHCCVTMFALSLRRLWMADTLRQYKYAVISQTCPRLLPSRDVLPKSIVIRMSCQMVETSLLTSVSVQGAMNGHALHKSSMSLAYVLPLSCSALLCLVPQYLPTVSFKTQLKIHLHRLFPIIHCHLQ